MRSTGVRAAILGVLAAAVWGATAQPASAQESGRIQGEVTVAGTGRPLVGAQVFIPGTNVGTLTNSAGRYLLLNVPAGAATVRVEMLGFGAAEQSVTVAAGQLATLDFALREAAVELDALVVTGTAGGARTREIGNSVSAIGEREIEVAPVNNTQDIISARATGATVLTNSGQPGAGGTIRLRGNNSVSQGNNPLIYVDGVRIYSNTGPIALQARQTTLPLNDINAEDIERVEIVKGPAATTLYGTEASGGVIQIFTKKGRVGAPAWTAEVTGGFNNMGHVGPDSDPTGLYLNDCRGIDLQNIDNGNPIVHRDPTCPESGSWLRNGPVQRYSLSVRGGTNEVTYFLSGNFGNEEGVVETGFSKDGGFRGNFSFRPTPSLDLALQSAYTKRVTRWVPDGNNAGGFLLNVMRGPFNNYKNAALCDDAVDYCTANQEVLNEENFNRSDHFITGLTIRHESGGRLTNRLAIGYDYNGADNDNLRPVGNLRSPRGFLWTQGWAHTTLSLDYVGTLRNEFGSAMTSSFSWGGQLFEDRDHETRVDAEDFAGPGIPTLTSGAKTEAITDRRLRVINTGFFLQEMIGWNDRLFVTAGLRVDGNSAFGEEFGLQPYPKVSASYVLSDHDFWPRDIWETMKLRAAVGESGKAPGAFDAVRTWDPIAADDGVPGVTPFQLGNPELGPERSREYEVGFDAGFLEGRVAVDFTYFRQNTFDALIPKRYPPSQGFLDRQLENIGELQNSGVELRLDGALIRNSFLEWRGRLNLSTNKSEAVDLGGEPEVSLGVENYVITGQPVPVIRGDRIVNADKFEDPVIEDDAIIGPGYPTRTIGIGTTLTVVQNLTLDVLGEWQGGHYLANWVGYQNARRGVWQPCFATQEKLRQALGPDLRKGTADDNPAAIADVTALQRGKCAIDRTVMNDNFWIQPADFFKLRTVSLTYQLPSSLIPRVRSASLTLSGRNLFTATDYDGVDPEVADLRDNGFARREYYNLPPTRQFLASLRVTF